MESRIREAILAAVEQNGGRIGNQNLIQQMIQAGAARRPATRSANKPFKRNANS